MKERLIQMSVSPTVGRILKYSKSLAGDILCPNGKAEMNANTAGPGHICKEDTYDRE